MFINLLNKLSACNQSCTPQEANDIQHIIVRNYKEDKLCFPTIQSYIESFKDMSKKRKTLLIVPDKDWKTFCKDYCHMLGLFYDEYLLIEQHSYYCTHYIDNFTTEVFSNANPAPILTKEEYGIPLKTINSHYEIYPIEYTQDLYISKIKHFQRDHIYDVCKYIQFLCYILGYSMPALLQQMRFNDQSAKIVTEQNKQELINIFQKFHINTDIITMSPLQYMQHHPLLGYDKTTIFKFNYPLFMRLRNRGYKINENNATYNSRIQSR